MASQINYQNEKLLTTLMTSSTFSIADGKRKKYVNIQCVLLILEQMPFYRVIWGYFELIKVGLKVMPHPCASGFKQILIGLSN